jgi:hypothetical protein
MAVSTVMACLLGCSTMLAGGACLMMEAVRTSEMVNSYQPAWHYNPEDSRL